jgi:soluble lytic murein transglycosylase-like protein
VPAPWIAAEIVVESRGQAHAGTLTGAYGLMQLEPGTMGLTNAERANPADNILAGAEYLAQLHATFQSWREASAAYYGGAGLVTALLPRVPMPWRTGQQWLDVVPNPGANTLTLAQYANTVFRVAHQWQGVRP